jgi:hypothetical protein
MVVGGRFCRLSRRSESGSDEKLGFKEQKKWYLIVSQSLQALRANQGSKAGVNG